MNYLFISKTELCVSDGHLLKACIKGARAAEAINDRDLKSDLTIACVVEGQGRGKVFIPCCSPEKIDLEISIEQNALPEIALDLVVAYSRPQAIKKILQLSSALGLRSLSFVKTENVVASYLQSKVLEERELRRSLLLGLEQSGGSNMPTLRFFEKFHEFINSDFISHSSGCRYYGDMQSESSKLASAQDTVLFLGPESGFAQKEKDILDSRGFYPISLGPRVLRVELAAAMLISRLVNTF